MTRNEVISDHYIINYKKLVKRASWRVPNKSFHLAEEVVQEAYTRALKFFKAYDPERGDFGAWFNRIYNCCVANCIKQENGQPSTSLDQYWDTITECNADADSPERMLAHLEGMVIDDSQWVPKDMAVQIKNNIEEQKPEVAEVLRMFFLLGMKTTDIADCTNQSHSNVRQIIYRFRIKWSDENIF